MKHRVCSWWLGYWLLNPLRKMGQGPHELLSPYVREGMTVLEPGPGMGFFTVELARLVGPSGRVLAVDVQPKMIEKLKRRLAKIGMNGQVDARVTSPESMSLGDLRDKVDFCLAFAVVHEFPDPGKFFAEVAEASRAGALLLLAEPKGHVKMEVFEAELQAAREAGFEIGGHPDIRRSQAALLKKLATTAN